MQGTGGDTHPVSASAITGTVGSREACIAPASTKSLRVAMAKSGMPRRDAVVAAPDWYKQSKPASKAQRALIPSQIPGATWEVPSVALPKQWFEGCTYNDTRASEHLTQAGCCVQGQGALQEVLRVQAGIVVGTRVTGSFFLSLY